RRPRPGGAGARGVLPGADAAGRLDAVTRLPVRPHDDATGSPGAISLLRRAARSVSSVSTDGDAADVLSLPLARSWPMPPGLGSARWTRPRMSAVRPGNRPWKRTASWAGSDRITSASPWRKAWTTCRAARSALIDRPGSESLMLNQAYS